MGRSNQWLFEIPPSLEATFYTNPYTRQEYYSHPELEVPPAWLKLFVHFLPGLTKPIPLEPSKLNPGYIGSNDELILSNLQSKLKNLLETKYKSGSKIRVALVDLTGPTKLKNPEYAGFRSTVETYGASCSKVAALYAAHQLRFDLMTQARANPGLTQRQIFKAWANLGISDRERERPNLKQIFNISNGLDDSIPKTIDFSPRFQETLETVATFGHPNYNKSASIVIDLLGFPYIASVLWQSGLYHPKRGGLWLGADYGGHTGKRDPIGGQSQGVNALSLATFYTLLAQDRLIDADASQNIKKILSQTKVSAANKGTFEKILRARGMLKTRDKIYSKFGVWGKWFHDGALIERTIGSGETLRYVAVILTESYDKSRRDGVLRDLLVDLDKLIQTNNSVTEAQELWSTEYESNNLFFSGYGDREFGEVNNWEELFANEEDESEADGFDEFVDELGEEEFEYEGILEGPEEFEEISKAVGQDQRAWILDLDRSAIELLPDSKQRQRFLEQIDWKHVEFPGNGPETPDNKVNWKLADELFSAIAVVIPEHRVPFSIHYRDVDRVVSKVLGQQVHKLFPEARDAFVRMRGAAAADGVQLVITSAWRSRQKQATIREGQPNPNAVAKVSAHMYGLAVDLRMSVAGLPVKEANTRTPEKMANLVSMYRSPVYKWMALHGREFGWYPYRREPWHWEYNPSGFKERFEGVASATTSGVSDLSASAQPIPQSAAKPAAELVRFAQQVLNVTEGERLNDDGNFGKFSRGALERFRKKYQLGLGGVLDAKTEIALAQRALEEIARQSLFPQLGTLDGKTEQALVAFKSGRGVGFNSKLDAATRAALANTLAQRASTLSKSAPMVNLLDRIISVAAKSTVARYQWRDRGVAPPGYIKGMALVYARVYCKLKAGDATAMEMAKANTRNMDKDALAHYSQEFNAAGMDNDSAGVNTLRHLFVLLIGLGMRESSGRYCQGRDRSASNTTADTAEAGLFQTSYNARKASPLMPQLFRQYLAKPSGFVNVFQEGVSCSNSNLENFGGGDGKGFQRLSKTCPAFAAEFAAVGLRNTRKHWGPINRKAAEIRPECDAMLLQVQQVVDEFNLCPVLQ